jgi:hypothetical protein
LRVLAKNQIWLELIQLAAELLAWTQLLALHDQPARTWEPKRLRAAVADRTRTARHHRSPTHPAPLQRWAWSDLDTGGHSRRAAHSDLGEPAILCRETGMSQHTLPTTNLNEPVYNSLAKDRGWLAAQSTLAAILRRALARARPVM